MIKGLAITPPVLGRISIGKVVERNGKRLPEKDDQFTITSQVQTRDGWLIHPTDEKLRLAQGKIRSIPVRMLFDDPELNFRVDYSLFDRATGRPVCVGNGETCKRMTAEGLKTLPCPSPQSCLIAQERGCKPYGRLNVLIGEDDPLGSFVFRTTGYNSIRTITARLLYFQAVAGDKLSCLPLELRLRGKSTRQSHGSPIYYVDLVLDSSATLAGALMECQQTAQERAQSGFDQAALDEAARKGFANGTFEETEEEIGEVVEEFFPDAGPNQTETTPGKRSLNDRLADKVQTLQGGTDK